MIKKKDVCIVIATFNRPEGVDRTLKHIIKQKPGKVFVIDQSEKKDTKDVVNRYKKKLNVEYVFSSQPSSSIAKNIGIKKGKKDYKIILIVDDDVDLLGNYLEEMLKEYNDHPKVMAVGGTLLGNEREKYDFKKMKNRILEVILKIFFLPRPKDHSSTVTGPYGLTFPTKIIRRIDDSEWIPGSNVSFRRECFEDYLCPESKGYNVLEDIDSSYYVFKKFGKGSLVRTPKCLVNHWHNQVARYPSRKRIFANHEDHFYFYYRHFYDVFGTYKLGMTLSGIIIGKFLKFLMKPSKDTLEDLRNNIDGTRLAIRNRDKIRKGKLRTFLNKDLSMKKI